MGACGGWAHPRSRGADETGQGETGQGEGSSPLARGGLVVGADCAVGSGLIPARAGRTGGWRGDHVDWRAHPRSRGADDLNAMRLSVGGGSSPLARGGRLSRSPARRVVRLIPARAGRTSPSGSAVRRPTAHPRSRGADQGDQEWPWPFTGSSPLARGGRSRSVCHCASVGLIPARAGRTTPAARPASTSRAHPRSRGADRRL